MLRVTPIYGSQWHSTGAAMRGSCTLVEFSHVKVLVNVGMPDTTSHTANTATATTTSATATATPTPANPATTNLLPPLPPHDCLVLSDSTLASLGALPLYCQAHPDTPIYATFPTVKMGQMTLWDYHAHLSLDGGRPPFTLEQMDAAIARLQTIKYSQAININNMVVSTASKNIVPVADGGISITAHRAGHVVGGAFWVLQRIQDETVVVITSTYSIAKEKHLDSSTLLQYGATPDVLVTRPGGPALPLVQELLAQDSSSNWKLPVLTSQAQKQLTESIMSVLRRDGNVLLPSDAAGRVLELILLLDQHWEKQRLGGTYNLVWLGPMVGNTLDFARSQLEWMNGVLGNQFQKQQGLHPYALKRVQLCASVSELETFLVNNANPTCVVANGMTLDHGPARDLLLKWADNDNNAIFFTDTSQCWERDPADGGVGGSSDATTAMIGTNNNTGGTTTTNMDMAPSSSSSLHHPAVPSPAAVLPNITTTSAAAPPPPPGVVTAADAVAAAEETEEAGEEDDTANRGRLIPKANASKFTAAYQLLHYWCQAKLQGREMDDSIDVDVLVPRRAPLTGIELAQFLELEEQARLSKRKQEEQAAMLRQVELAKGRLRLGEQEKEEQHRRQQVVQNPNLKFLRPKKKSRFDSSLFLKFSKPLHLTFVVKEDAVGIGQTDAALTMGEMTSNENIAEDDYGIAVQPDHFVDIVTGVDPSKFAGGSGRIGEEVLRRGFGFGTVDGNKENSKSKRGDNATGEEGEDELDERGLEAMDLSEGRGIIRGRQGRPPTKVTTETRRIQVFCEIDYIPLEGRVDSRAARQSVRALQPRQVVVLGGTQPIAATTTSKNDKQKNSAIEMTTDEVRILAEAAESFSSTTKKVFCPSDTETVELKVGHAAYSVRLIATPYRPKDERDQEGEPPIAVELHEAKLGACTVSFLDHVATGQRVALDGSIVLAPRAKASNQLSIYLSDGEVLLTDLRTELIAQGMKAEYSTHSGYARLVVNGKVVVKKDKDSGRVNVEGPLCEDFFTVRSIVCGQFVTL